MQLTILAGKLHVENGDAALEKSLNIANFIADIMNNREQRLLVEHSGHFTELNGWKQ